MLNNSLKRPKLLSCPGCPYTSVHSCAFPHAIAHNEPFLLIHLNFQSCSQPHNSFRHSELPLGTTTFVLDKFSQNRKKVQSMSDTTQEYPRLNLKFHFKCSSRSNWAISHQVFYPMGPLFLIPCPNPGNSKVKRESKDIMETGSAFLNHFD